MTSERPVISYRDACKAGKISSCNNSSSSSSVQMKAKAKTSPVKKESMPVEIAFDMKKTKASPVRKKESMSPTPTFEAKKIPQVKEESGPP